MEYINQMTLIFESHSINEGFARSAVALRAAYPLQILPRAGFAQR